MNSIKKGVRLYGLQPEMVLIDTVVQSVFEAFEEDCRRTSIVGKEHKHRSLHNVMPKGGKPKGYAIDYKTKHIEDRSIKFQILHKLREKLPQCDILLEHEDKPQEHIHCEYDDKLDILFQKHKAIYKQTGEWP